MGPGESIILRFFERVISIRRLTQCGPEASSLQGMTVSPFQSISGARRDLDRHLAAFQNSDRSQNRREIAKSIEFNAMARFSVDWRRWDPFFGATFPGEQNETIPMWVPPILAPTMPGTQRIDLQSCDFSANLGFDGNRIWPYSPFLPRLWRIQKFEPRFLEESIEAVWKFRWTQQSTVSHAQIGRERRPKIRNGKWYFLPGRYDISNTRCSKYVN